MLEGAAIAARVAAACEIQKRRYPSLNGETPIRTNAEADGVCRIHVAEALSFRRVAPNRIGTH